jgi:aryl-alcohol dehydrogenase-like predicted oxidoreductase
MIYRNLSNTDLKVSAITFGAWAIGGWMWGGADRNDAMNALDAAMDIGMTSIDTAAVYGFGQSEEIVGKAIKGKRDKVQIFTKYGLRWDDTKGQFFFNTTSNEGKPLDIYKYSSKESVIKECEISLKKLGTDYIDLYQIHWADPTTPISETFEAIEILKKQGKIRFAGVCNYDAALVGEALKSFPIVSDQVPYSMLNRQIESELVPFCINNKVDILAYSPLQRGILTGKMKPGHHFNEGDTRPSSPYYKEPNFSRVLAFIDQIRPIANNRKVTVGQLVINWTLQQPAVVTALVGARNKEQVLDNAKAVEFTLTTEEINEINSKLNNLTIDK